MVESPRYWNPNGGCPKTVQDSRWSIITCALWHGPRWNKVRVVSGKTTVRLWLTLSCDLLRSPEVRCKWMLRHQERDLKIVISLVFSMNLQRTKNNTSPRLWQCLFMRVQRNNMEAIACKTVCRLCIGPVHNYAGPLSILLCYFCYRPVYSLCL